MSGAAITIRPLRFRADLYALVLDGSKTVTRRKVKTGAGNVELPCRFEAGQECVAVAADAKRYDRGERVRIVSVRREHVRDITDEDARREGYPNRGAFLAAWWTEFYPTSRGAGQSLFRDDAVWRIEFERVAS